MEESTNLCTMYKFYIKDIYFDFLGSVILLLKWHFNTFFFESWIWNSESSGHNLGISEKKKPWRRAPILMWNKSFIIELQQAHNHLTQYCSNSWYLPFHFFIYHIIYTNFKHLQQTKWKWKFNIKYKHITTTEPYAH